MANLSELQTRVKTSLMDVGSQIWGVDNLTEALRLALGEVNLASKAAVTMAGLDGALVTTLPGLQEGLVVWGAAGYAALARAVDRMERGTSGASDAGSLKSWGEARLREFRGMLGTMYPGYLVMLSGSAGSGGGAAGEDPGKLAAEIALMGAQSAKTSAEAAAVSGQEGRAVAASAAAAAEKAAEQSRLAGLHGAADGPWGTWDTSESSHYPEGYDRS